MKRLLLLAVALLAVAIPLSAQTNGIYTPRTDSFVFNNALAITEWDNVNNPYPYENGSVSFTSPNEGIVIPFQLGYLNNGYLVPCDPIAWGTKTWTVGDGTHNGDTYTLPGSTTCPYFTGEYGTYGNSNNILDGFSVVVTYVRSIRRVCGRGGCHNIITDTIQGGTGVASQTEIN